MSLLPIILLSAVGLLFIVQMLYLLLLYHAPARQYRRQERLKAATDASSSLDETLPALSVIIVTSNQDYLLRRNLPAVLGQDYPDFEVIVVDDNSTDETPDILQQLAAQHPRLRTTFVPPTSRRISHRKLALTLGIKAARGQWLAFTDADCCPDSNQWLRSMAAEIAGAPASDNRPHPVEAVVGYTGYIPARGLPAILRRFDNMLHGLRLLGLAACGRAHMAYATNLLYRRDIFFDHKGYSAHLHLERGDDDIFVNRAIPPRRIRAAVSPDAVVRCTDTTRRRWRLERLGRIATRHHLRGLCPLLLALDTLTRLLFLAAIVVAIVLAALNGWWVVLAVCAALWAIRYAVAWVVWHRAARALAEPDYGPAIPLLEVVQPLAELSLRIQYLFSSKQRYRRKQL